MPKKRKRVVFVKFLEPGNTSPIRHFKYPRTIRPGFVTDKVDQLQLCASGWHFCNTQEYPLLHWWSQNDKCYVIIPIGKKIKDFDKYCAQQIVFIGQINDRRLLKMWYKYRKSENYIWLHKEAEKILTKWEKKNGRNGKLFITKLRKKEQASKRM